SNQAELRQDGSDGAIKKCLISPRQQQSDRANSSEEPDSRPADAEHSQAGQQQRAQPEIIRRGPGLVMLEEYPHIPNAPEDHRNKKIGPPPARERPAGIGVAGFSL